MSLRASEHATLASWGLDRTGSDEFSTEALPSQVVLMHRTFLLLLVGSAGLAAPAVAQGPPSAAPAHGLKFESEYDAERDARTVTLVLDKGRYFIRWHRPRVTAVVQHSGRAPSARPDTLFIEFRTQSPQYTNTNKLTITTSAGAPLVVTATGSRVYHRVQTVDHTLTFPVAIAELEPLLTAVEGEMEVGGVRVRLERRHFAGLAELLQRVTPEEQSLAQ